MPTTTTTRRPARTPEQWDTLAREEIVPALQAGTSMTEIRARYGAGHTIRRALARIGYNTKGQPIDRREVTATRPKVLADRVAARRREGAAWWLLELESEKTERELKELLRAYGHENLADGRVTKEVLA